MAADGTMSFVMYKGRRFFYRKTYGWPMTLHKRKYTHTHFKLLKN